MSAFVLINWTSNDNASQIPQIKTVTSTKSVADVPKFSNKKRGLEGQFLAALPLFVPLLDLFPALSHPNHRSSVRSRQNDGAVLDSGRLRGEGDRVFRASGALFAVFIGLNGPAFAQNTAASSSELKLNSLSGTSTSDASLAAVPPLSVPAFLDTSPVGKKIDMSWGMGLTGQLDHNDLGDRQDGVLTSARFSLTYGLSNWAFLEVQPQIQFMTGHIQAATDSNGRSYNIILRKADVTFTDHNYTLASAGVLQLDQFLSPLLIDVPLPGIKVVLSTGLRNAFSADIFGIAGIPGSSTNSNNSDQVDQTPSFSAAGLQLHTRQNFFNGILSLAYFQYSNLPTSVTNDSVKLGNTPQAAGPLSPNSNFRYTYGGEQVAFNSTWKFNPWLGWDLKAAWIHNEQTVPEYSQGYSLYNELAVGVGGGWTLLPNFNYFNIAPDATVADFNQDIFGTNRDGYLIGLALAYQKEFKFGVVGGERNVLFESALQAHETYFGIVLEATNVNF
jgi:hypothetical protein